MSAFFHVPNRFFFLARCLYAPIFTVVFEIDCFSVMILCISWEASNRAKQFCVLTTT